MVDFSLNQKIWEVSGLMVNSSYSLVSFGFNDVFWMVVKVLDCFLVWEVVCRSWGSLD